MTFTRSRPWMRLARSSTSGDFWCVNTSDGSTNWHFAVTTGSDKRIRSGAALDANSTTVYFQCNNGLLYALDANSGAQRWTNYTGNVGGPPAASTFHTQPFSSSPVVGADGTVYVASSDGSVRAFNHSNGAQLWRVTTDKNTNAFLPFEASLAVGQNGWLYAAARALTNPSTVGRVHAINPVIAATNATLATQWTFNANDSTIGFVASPVIDQEGFVYTTAFGDHLVDKLDGSDGTLRQNWSVPGKTCQTPSINQNGLLIIGVSDFSHNGQEVNEIAALKIADPNSDAALWAITQVGGQNLGNVLGSPAILCTSAG